MRADPLPGGSTVIPAAPPKAVLLDWDGTLVDCWGAIHRALAETLGEYGLPAWSAEETRRRVRSLKDYFPAVFGDRWETARVAFRSRYHAVHLQEMRVLPGALDLIETALGMGVPVAVVSNKTGEALRLESSHLGWTGHFHRLVGSGDAPRDKPDPAPVGVALEGTGIAPGEHVWLVGDSPIDVACARGAGCLPVVVGAADGVNEAEFGSAWRLGHCGDVAAFLRRFQTPVA